MIDNVPKIAVMGGGSWATAIAKIILRNVPQITWYMRRQEQIDELFTNTDTIGDRVQGYSFEHAPMIPQIPIENIPSFTIEHRYKQYYTKRRRNTNIVFKLVQPMFVANFKCYFETFLGGEHGFYSGLCTFGCCGSVCS